MSVVENVPFTRKGIAVGIRYTLPIAVGAIAFSAVFGVLARQASLSPLEAILMSGLVFAGASQFIALELWSQPIPIVAIIFTTFIVNLRHVLMGAAFRPWLAKLSLPKLYGPLFFLTDETWALAARHYREGGRDAGFILGSGLTMFVSWVGGTILGTLAGAALTAQDMAAWALDFLFTAVFTALLMGLWRGKGDLLPWAVAALTALVTHLLIPGTWYIIAGGVAGSLTGAFLDNRKSLSAGQAS